MATTVSFRGQLLWENIKRGDLSAVVNLMESGGINLEERDENGQTFLMYACERGELSIVRELLEADVDVNAVDNESWSALLCAAKEGHLEIVIELLERGAVMDHRDMCNWTALMWTCYKGKTTVVQELLERGANPNVKADHNMTCLTWAAGRGYTEIVSMLLVKGAKVNSPDKYGTTPLIWASRKGYVQIVQMLLQAGANVDIAGMNSWTALLAAAKGGFTELVQSILEHNANANSLDEDGFTALTIAAKEGFVQITQDLLSHGAYVNLRDRDGDSILIHAVKGGHFEVVQALLNKYADVDIQGAEGKTALYWSVEKGHPDITRLMLSNDADTEIATKVDDTPLLRAVKSRNEECVRLLLEKNAKVSSLDKRGDTALHISLRARSKRITELLLRNPKNSRLLYRHNKSGETPYNIDAYYQKGILTQIFGHRNLNASDGENLLGYEIYSSALADILSEPSLNTPITVGLYAKWGSGKSFLLGKLQSEMKSFTQQNVETHFHLTRIFFFMFFLLNSIVGLALGLSTLWSIGLGVGLGLFVLEYGFLAFIWVASRRYDLQFAERISSGMRRKMDILRLLLKVLFYNPKRHNVINVPTVRFLFSDYTRITSVGGEKALAAMIGTLCDAVEHEFSSIVTRLYRVFKPEQSTRVSGRFKSICCIPYFFLVLLFLAFLATGVILLVLYHTDNSSVNVILITITCLLGLALVGNLYTWGQAVASIYISQKNRVLQAAEQLETLKVDGFMQKLKQEVDLMSEMVTNMDTFTGNQTRLVVVVDGLDSCEQDKILQFLDTIKTLFSDTDSPFITILAIDPHIIIRGIEHNLRSTFHDANIHGYDYMRNIVHLPFYLQSQGVRIQKEEYVHRTSSVLSTDAGSAVSDSPRFRHQDSMMSSLSLAEHKHKKSVNSRKKSSRMNSSTWHTSSFDLSKTLVKNDYFSDINPRSMRRLMNIVAVTGRLLRAYNLDFSWYRLSGWINIIEQWPYRVSWIIVYWEEHDGIEDNCSLQALYDKISDKIPASKEVEPLLEIDRNVRKLETFLSSHSACSPVLNVGDLKKFLPCTINLDPYLRKLIRELRQIAEANRTDFPFPMGYPPPGPMGGGAGMEPGTYGLLGNLNRQSFSPQGTPTRVSMTTSQQRPPPMMTVPRHLMSPAMMPPYYMGMMPPMTAPPQIPSIDTRPRLVFLGPQSNEKMSQLSPGGVFSLLSSVEGIDKQQLLEYERALLENNINGMVILSCELDELKHVMKMKFGDWQLFRIMVLTLRDREVEIGQERHRAPGEQCESQSSANVDELDCNEGEALKLKKFTKRKHHGNDRDLEAPVAVYVDQKGKYPLLSQSSQDSMSYGGRLEGAGQHRSSNSSLSRQQSNNDSSGKLNETDGQPEARKTMRRNNSILQQVEYENEMLREVFENFMSQEDQDDEESPEEFTTTDDSIRGATGGMGQPATSSSNLAATTRPSSAGKSKMDKMPSVRFFVENEENASAMVLSSMRSEADVPNISDMTEMRQFERTLTSTPEGESAGAGNQSSDCEPLLSLPGEKEKTSDSSSHRERKPKFGLGSLVGKGIPEEKRPLGGESSDEEDALSSSSPQTSESVKTSTEDEGISLSSVTVHGQMSSVSNTNVTVSHSISHSQRLTTGDLHSDIESHVAKTDGSPDAETVWLPRGGEKKNTITSITTSGKSALV